MAIRSVQSVDSAVGEKSSGSFTSMQRYMLRRFHPQAVLLDTAAAMWVVYFLWHHQWLAAVGAIVVSRLMGSALARDMDYASFAEGLWGKLALLHLEPFNVTLQIVSAVVALYGVWAHSTVTILLGLTGIFLGHLFGWKKLLKGI